MSHSTPHSTHSINTVIFNYHPHINNLSPLILLSTKYPPLFSYLYLFPFLPVPFLLSLWHHLVRPGNRLCDREETY